MLPSKDVEELSQQIINRVSEIIDWDKIHFAHCFLPIKKNNEVDLRRLLKIARQQKPNLHIASSGMGDRNSDTHWLGKNLKPKTKVTNNMQYDLILVPMLGFDEKGYRIGYGGGFYDWLLSAQRYAQIIGVCYELGKVKKLPHEDHDIALPTIVTEKTIYKF